MFVSESCEKCLFDSQKRITDNPEYLAEVKRLLSLRGETDSAPYMVYQFDQVYRRMFGEPESFAGVKKKYNDLALSMEDEARRSIRNAQDPLAQAFLYARAGNYIDFGVMSEVDSGTFMRLFSDVRMSEADMQTYALFLERCRSARHFVLIADNCGEILFDRLMLEELKKRFPEMEMSVLVRGGEALNDATGEDARYVGMDRVARIVPNGNSAAGTIEKLLSGEAKAVLDEADVILSKGQGNFESLSRSGEHIFHAFLCKCDLFTERYHVPKLTGMFVVNDR